MVGGSGFVGRSIQDLVRGTAAADALVFSYRTSESSVHPELHSVHLDLLDPRSVVQVGDYGRAIWVAGNADHALGWTEPESDFTASAITMMRFLKYFRGELTMLSSQAVYFGLAGSIGEDVDHVPAMPYGFAKLAAERYARWALDAGDLRTLWVSRLMYAFGRQEPNRRLMQRCIAAADTGGAVTVFGGGRSFLNPLPAEFLADVLLHAAEAACKLADGHLEIVNTNHERDWTVRDVVELLARVRPFTHDYVDTGEKWPVAFRGDATRLLWWLERWGMTLPDIDSALTRYSDEMTGRNLT